MVYAKNRKLVLCPSTEHMPVDQLLKECPECNMFFFYCCHHGYKRQATPCHNLSVVFTDGACLDNGLPGARAGVGVAFGSIDKFQQSIPLDGLDASVAPSNQRAELQAAIAGIRALQASNDKIRREFKKDSSSKWIVVTDSEYVVKGMTEWMPTWKANHWRTSKGTPPANLDLFFLLDKEIRKQEGMNIEVIFWHIPRRYNAIADRLAKRAAEAAPLALV